MGNAIQMPGLANAPVDEGFTPVPQDTYAFRVRSIESKTSKKGKAMLQARYEITGGEFKGRTVLDHFTLEGSQEGLAISAKRLKTLLSVLGLTVKKDDVPVQAMLGKTFSAFVTVDGPNNHVANYLAGEATKPSSGTTSAKKAGRI